MKLGIIATQMADGLDAGVSFAFDVLERAPRSAPRLEVDPLGGSVGSLAPSRKRGGVVAALPSRTKTPRRRLS